MIFDQIDLIILEIEHETVSAIFEQKLSISLNFDVLNVPTYTYLPVYTLTVPMMVLLGH